MLKVAMRPRIRKVFETEKSPQVVLEELTAHVPENYDLTYKHTDSDNTTFELVNKNQNITISGRIKRWQGTQSRINLDVVVDVPVRVSFARKLTAALITGIPLIIAIQQFILPWLLYLAGMRDYPSGFVTSAPTAIALVTLLFTLLFTILLIGVVGLIASSLLLKDSNVNKRWQSQQELNKQLATLTSMIETDDEIDTSRLTEQEANIKMRDIQQATHKSAYRSQ